jgi:WD40 repeat protein
VDTRASRDLEKKAYSASTPYKLKPGEMVAEKRPSKSLAPVVEERGGIFRFMAAMPLAVLRGHSSEVRSVAFSPDGKIIASGAKNGTIRFWEMPLAGRESDQGSVMAAHEDGVESMAFSPDARFSPRAAGTTTSSSGTSQVAPSSSSPCGLGKGALKVAGPWPSARMGNWSYSAALTGS